MWQLLVVTLLIVSAKSQSCEREVESLCFDPTCGVPLYDPDVLAPCYCSEDNLGEYFSGCKSDNTRDLFYYWKPPAVCLNGTLPQPVTGIPCTLQCFPGTYLNLSISKTSCQPCPVGTISFGGGHKWSEWHRWPGQVSTFCTINNVNQQCQPWFLDGETTNSGDNHNLNSMESILELSVYLVTTGYVRFAYKVSAEEYFDGLVFVIDGAQRWFKSNQNWTTENVTLNAGHHTIQWKYHKDISLTRGDDMATIRFIEIFGTSFAVTNCELCPLGHYNNRTGHTTCSPCPANTYSDTFGASACTPCDPDKYSFPGSSSCSIRKTCTAEDTSYYSTWVSECIDGLRWTNTSWIYPLACDAPENVSLPANTSAPCVPDPCKPGQYRDDTGRCHYCADGTYSQGGTATTCQDCGAGAAADNRRHYFHHWFRWPNDTGVFTTNCTQSTCYTRGWRLAKEYVDSGVGHGFGAESVLEWKIVAFNGAHVSFNYSIQCLGNNKLLFLVDDIIQSEFSCSRHTNCTDASHWREHRHTLRNFESTSPAKLWSVKWIYRKDDTAVYPCDRALMKDLVIIGSDELHAGSAECTPCRNGSYAPTPRMDECLQCSMGQTSTPDKRACTACPMGTYNDRPGGSCMECGRGTTSTTDRTHCTYNCSAVHFSIRELAGNKTYNISALPSFNVTFTKTSNTTEEELLISGNLCGWEPSCTDILDRAMDTYVCMHNSSGFFTVNMGRVVSLFELATPGGIRFQFTGGSRRRENVTCMTTLDARCDPGVENGQVQISDTFDYDTFVNDCHLELYWNTRYACAVCEVSDYAFYERACTDGKKERVWYWTTPYCYGGATLPPNEIMDCSPEVVVNQSTVIAVIVVGSIVLLAALGGIAFLYYKHKKLYQSYSQLRNNVPLEDTEK